MMKLVNARNASLLGCGVIFAIIVFSMSDSKDHREQLEACKTALTNSRKELSEAQTAHQALASMPPPPPPLVLPPVPRDTSAEVKALFEKEKQLVEERERQLNEQLRDARAQLTAAQQLLSQKDAALAQKETELLKLNAERDAQKLIAQKVDAAMPPSPPCDCGHVITLGNPLRPSSRRSLPEVRVPSPNGHDPWYRCAYHSHLINHWYYNSEAKRFSIEEVPQEKKFYIDIAVITAKRHLQVDSAMPTSIEIFGEFAFPGYNGIVNMQAAGREVAVSFSHDFLDEPEVLFEEPRAERRVILAVCEQNRLHDWQRFVKDMARMDVNTFTLCVVTFPGNPGNHEADMKANNIRDGHHIRLEMQFSRAAGLDACARLQAYADDDIIVTTDVDVFMPMDVLQAARRYVSLGKRAMFPVGPNRALHQAGLAAFSIGDYKRVGGFDTARYGNRYGYEDTDLYYRLRLGRVIPVRFFHEELRHIDHEHQAGWSGVNTPHGEFHHCKGFGYKGEEEHHLESWNTPLSQLQGV